VKVLVVDDHAVVREGVAAVLRQLQPDAEVLLAHDAASGMALAAANPDLELVLLDLMLPDAVGMGALEAFGREHPALPVMVLSSSESPDAVRAALELGAMGYVAKSANPETLLAALRLVLSGEVYVPPFMVHAPAPPTPAGALTERQVEVLRLLAEGVANKEIAYRLGLSEKTVKSHLTAIFRTLGVSNRAQAVAAAARYPMA
jgi:DNA-binding NarL/FixJ family response regulator